MKILILQLARLGDIYQSWPALRALRRKHPTAEIHVLTRPRFADAFKGLEVLDKLIEFQTKEILTPLVHASPDIKAAYEKLDSHISMIKSENYDWIVNYSFSPVSSYLAHAVASDHSMMTGYSRFTDGYLHIPDDMSAYFYAQVGVGKPNRFHLAEIFASMVEAGLEESDWASADLPSAIRLPDKKFIAIHIGASEQVKSISAAKWTSIISKLTHKSDCQIVLIGAHSEMGISDAITASFSEHKVVSIVGKTVLTDLFSILSRAVLLVGCDSAPIHIASLTKTKTLNISFPSVNFWETGPRAPESFVIKARSEEDLVSDQVADTIISILENKKLNISLIKGKKGTPSYQCFTSKESDFNWNLLKAIYQGEAFPVSDSADFYNGLAKLEDINLLILEQLEQLEKGVPIENLGPIINQAEEVINTISKIVPSLGILIRWYQTEKIRIPPADFSSVLEQTKKIHLLFAKALSAEVWSRNEQTHV